MSWAAVIGGAASLGSAYLGSKSGGQTSGVSALQQNPQLYSSFYGQGSIQPKYNKNGVIKNQAEINAAQANAQGGLLPQATNLLNSNPTGLNQSQTSALQQGVNYLTSPESLAGANAASQVSNTFLNQLQNANTTPAPSGINGTAPVDINSMLSKYGGSTPVDLNAIRSGFQADMGKLQGMMPAQVQASAPTTAGSVGGLGLNYKDAANQALSGSVDNPYLREMATNAADVASQNYARNIAPVTRAGARMSGMYGGSRQGIAEGIAQGDLNRAITDASTNLYGNAYESAQSRAAQMASQLAGYDQQANMQNAQLQQNAGQFNASQAQQAALANQSAGLQGMGIMANYDLGAQGLGQDAAHTAAQYDLGQKGLGLDAAGLATNYDTQLRNLGINQGNLDLNNRQLTSQNAIQGANLAQNAASIPFQNLQSLYGLGTTVQQAPWNQMGQYASLLGQAPGSAGQTSYQQQPQASGSQVAGGLLSMAGGMIPGLVNQYQSNQLGMSAMPQSTAYAQGLNMNIQPITGLYPNSMRF